MEQIKRRVLLLSLFCYIDQVQFGQFLHSTKLIKSILAVFPDIAFVSGVNVPSDHLEYCFKAMKRLKESGRSIVLYLQHHVVMELVSNHKDAYGIIRFSCKMFYDAEKLNYVSGLLDF